jgi:uncharacterized membrane protein YeaQ/YmgE (transglycosylase-associated protein family)
MVAGLRSGHVSKCAGFCLGHLLCRIAAGVTAPRTPDRKESDMTMESLLILLLVGAVVGWLAGLIVRGYGFGLIGNIVVGIVGAFLAGWLLPRLGVSFTLGNALVTTIVYDTIGAVVLLLLIGLVRRA